jgi:DNA-binding protein YbaB
VTSAEEWLQQAQQRNDRLLHQAAELQQAVMSARGTARSSDGQVTVVVAPGGALVSLQLDDRALDRGARALQAAIMDTVQLATADAAAQLEDLVRPIVGSRFDEAVSAAQAEPAHTAGMPERTGSVGDDEDLSHDRLFRTRD